MGVCPPVTTDACVLLQKFNFCDNISHFRHFFAIKQPIE
ncbi:hypothetical protein [Staphylococcus aureus]|nr:hypothetical protein [Staphylococcus aureus]MCL9700459.1 hypothetical protein [Staphylococcus aureus]UXT86602.1 hypothetical protein MUA47_12535 [Staphylococcus aureus]UXU41771.1 hypothetical protein MUA85_12585 [Staphylococcus aureus]UXU44394.1 hypothetical protein MUA38_12590 [Staphylococcus aureus]HEE9173310.1 hypothetical protein [Staphylococcus aureus]